MPPPATLTRAELDAVHKIAVRLHTLLRAGMSAENAMRIIGDELPGVFFKVSVTLKKAGYFDGGRTMLDVIASLCDAEECAA